MRFLKMALVIMGVIIVAGYGYLGLEVIRRVANKAERAEPALFEGPVASGPAVVVAAGAAGAAGLNLDLPAGTRLGEFVATGNRVVFVAHLPDGPDRVYVLDPRTGGVALAATSGKPAAH